MRMAGGTSPCLHGSGPHPRPRFLPLCWRAYTYYQDPNYNNTSGAPMFVSGASLSDYALFIGDEIAPYGATSALMRTGGSLAPLRR
jgi:hypothetical protein